MQAGVGAVIASVSYEMGRGVVEQKDGILIIIMVLAFVLNYVMNINVVYIILLTGLFGIVRTLLLRGKN